MRIIAATLLLATALGACAPSMYRTSPPRATAKVDLAASTALIKRVVPGRSRVFQVTAIPDSNGLDVFEVEQDAQRVVLRGSSGVAIASALNWYLENVAGVNVSLPLQPIRLDALPAVPAKVRITTPYARRYFFNYCTSARVHYAELALRG